MTPISSVSLAITTLNLKRCMKIHNDYVLAVLLPRFRSYWDPQCDWIISMRLDPISNHVKWYCINHFLMNITRTIISTYIAPQQAPGLGHPLNRMAMCPCIVQCNPPIRIPLEHVKKGLVSDMFLCPNFQLINMCFSFILHACTKQVKPQPWWSSWWTHQTPPAHLCHQRAWIHAWIKSN